MTLELTRLQPTERNRATAKKLNGFREVLDEVNQLLAQAGDHHGRLQLHDRLVAQCAIVRAVLGDSSDIGCRRTLYSFAKALRILCDFAAKGLGAVTVDATKRTISGALMSDLTEDSSAGTWVGTLEAWLKTAQFIQTYESDLLSEVYLANLLKPEVSFRDALPYEPEPEPIMDEVVENPPAGAASELNIATAKNLRAVANSVANANALLGGWYGCSDGAIRRSNAVLCKAEVLRWMLDQSVCNGEQEPDRLPGMAASMAATALTARSEAGATVVMVQHFNGGIRFIAREGDLDAEETPTGSIWIGDFEAWRRVADFALSKLRMGADPGTLARALSEGPATALTGGRLLARKVTPH